MSGTGFTLRPIAEGDLPFLRRLYGSTRQEELAVVDWPEGQKETFLDQQFAAQHRWYQEQYPGASFEVVEVGGARGWLYVARWERELRLVDLVLLPAFRGQGVGTALLQGLLAEGRVAGKRVSLHAERISPALSLYGRLGFELREDKGVYLLLQWTPCQEP